MADEKWRTVRKIFDDALRQKPEERQKFVNQVCGGDKTLLAEVDSLLSSLDGADSFMETPAVAEVAHMIEIETKKLEAGECLGHYEIIEQIGAGGMGEVYLARDKKLDRKVAVKILNEEFSRHESNLNRFIREAKAASSLNHPNILVVHEIGEHENTNYIVSEFIEGKTLREILKERLLRLSEVLDISIPIADALCTAHSSNIIHRDIKPDNVMIRPDGLVKILDFGIEEFSARNPDHIEVPRQQALLFALRGDFRSAEAMIPTILSTHPPYDLQYHHAAHDIACIYALEGKSDEAVRWLKEAAAIGFPSYPLFERDAYLNRIRQAPEFIKFMAEMKAHNEKYRRDFG